MFNFLNPDDDRDARLFSESVARFADETLSSVQKFRRSDFDAMAKLGLCGLGVEERFGGIPLASTHAAALLFEIAKRNLGCAVYLSVHQMVTKLLAAQKSTQAHETLLSRLATGELLAAFCLTEANAGSDAAALRTKAVETENGFELSGEKIYISSAPHADIFLVFARVPETYAPETQQTGKSNTATVEQPRGGISCFLVDANHEGVEIGPEEAKMGAEASPIASVTFSKCHIPKARLLGKIGEGYSIALSALGGGRVSIAAAACGIAASALEKSTEYVSNRSQFGKQLSEFQGLQFMLADMMMSYRASVLLTKEAAQCLDSASQSTLECSIAKCFASDSAMKICTDAVQLLGGAGYLKDYGVEQLMRDAKMLQIVEGTNQIQRILIARSLIR